jgi:DNA modification methylase
VITILHGDCRDVLRTLPSASVQCVVTSPPYWGLRDYGVAGQLGMELTYQEHIRVMVEVFREVRRVLRADGTLWLNYGDCYATSVNGRSAADTKAVGNDDRTFRDKPFSTIQGALKPKDLVMMPARIAIALQEDGWWLRSDIIWAKPNPMPESITDRPATSHEHIFLLAKSARYFYDAEAVREPCESGPSDLRKMAEALPRIGGKHKTLDDPKSKASAATNIGQRRSVGGKPLKQDGHGNRHAGFNARWDEAEKAGETLIGRNCRSVWTIATAPLREAHFATFPPALAERCILAGSGRGDMVLDPFGGAGTVGLVADRLGRNATLIELNPEYCTMAERRVTKDAGLFAQVATA